MIGAVAPLLGPGTFLGFQRRDGTIDGYTTTYGIPTGNELRDLSDGSMLNLTEAVSLDRLGHTHDGPLVPDVAVAPAHGSIEPVLEAAQAWLDGQAACVHGP
jgi:C-terminal processing protease CtpA/Prc